MIYQYAVSDRGYLSCPVRQVLRQNTHLVDQFVVQMPAQIDGIAIDEWLLRIEMSLPGGYAYMTAALPLAGGAITYDVEQAVTADAGIAIVEIVAQHGDAVWKSSQSNYYIAAAINAEQLIPQQSPTWLDQLNVALADALAAAETLEVAEGAEQARIAAEKLRASAESARVALYNGIKADYESGAFIGPQGPQGSQGLPGIDGVNGADGKTAYQSAIDGGYGGAESAFYADLAAMQGLAAELEGVL